MYDDFFIVQNLNEVFLVVLLSRYFSPPFENTTHTKFHPLYTLLNKNYLGRRFTDHINDVFVQYKLLFLRLVFIQLVYLEHHGLRE